VTSPDLLVADGRSFVRLRPVEAYEAQQAGALIVDIRPASQRRSEGEIPGSLTVAGPLRDWRLGGDSPIRVADAGHELAVVVIGDGSHASLLAASALRGLGVAHATDVVGGYEAWRAARLPVSGGFTLAGRVVDGFRQFDRHRYEDHPVAV
jgi:rhodanese-related sulfurtransferase